MRASSKSSRTRKRPSSAPSDSVIPAPGGAELPRSRYQRADVEWIPRTSIRNAPYNPRTIDPYARKRLESNIKKRKLLGTLVVNRRTMNLVAGHQRLACLDALEGKPDYLLAVTFTDLTDAQEREQNLFMNARGAQGDWDLPLLAEVLRSDGVSYEAAGFDRVELELMLPELGSLFDHDQAPGPVKEAVKQVGDIVDLKRQRKRYRERDNAGGASDVEFYCVLVFRDADEVSRFLDYVGADSSERYIDGRLIADRVGLDLSQG